MIDNLPPRRPNTRPPIRWSSESATAQLFYAIKAYCLRRWPGRRWTNDTVFEWMVKDTAERYGLEGPEGEAE